MLIKTRKSLLVALKNAKAVAVSYISNYDWRYSSNGGKYLETDIYTPLGDGKYAHNWSTSCEMLPDEEYDDVSLRTLWKEVIHASHSEDYEVWIAKDGNNYLVAPI